MVYAKESFDLKKINQLIHTKIMGKKALSSVPNYSKNMARAMDVQKRMADLGFCCFELNADYTYCYRAQFIHGRDHDKTYVMEVEDSPALAVCVAALVANDVPLKAFKGKSKPRKIKHIRLKDKKE